MTRHPRLFALALLTCATPAAAMSDAPLRVTQVTIDQLEVREGDDGTVIAWEADAWHGGDTHKLFLRTEGERLIDPDDAHEDAATEQAETRLAWNRAVSPFWDVQLGVRRDWQPDDPNRDWASLGFQGIAPYRFEIDTTLFAGESGLTNLRLEAEYELLLTQKLVLTPELEINLYGKDDADLRIGSGLSDIEAGLRLRYEVRREFAPYVGLHWERLFGDTADFKRETGGDPTDSALVAGVRFWW